MHGKTGGIPRRFRGTDARPGRLTSLRAGVRPVMICRRWPRGAVCAMGAKGAQGLNFIFLGA
ncbi:hypothetical protein T261_4687 [Streptomyces lydicus]|nr:hypothetical protein T261_4687 [Streptomyces lydicus]